MQKETTCAFTGHRLIAKQQLEPLKRQLHTAVCSLIEEGFTDFCSGGALGFDQLAAQTVIQLKQTFPHIRLCMVLPCKNQDECWNAKQKEAYRRILTAADDIVYIGDRYYDGCMQKRNRYLVDSASCLLAHLKQNRGGTKYTVKYAEQVGVPVLFLDGTESYQLSIC